MRAFTTLSAVGILLLLSSCDAVLTKSPITRETNPLLQEQLTGVWQHEDGTLHVAFDAKGNGHTASLEWSNDEFKLEQAALQAAEFNGEKFLSVKPEVEDPDDAPKGYILAHFRLTGKNELQVFSPKIKAFEEAVNSGAMKGKVEKGKYSTLILVDDAKPLLEKSDVVKKLFDQKEPLVLRRLPEYKKESPE